MGIWFCYWSEYLITNSLEPTTFTSRPATNGSWSGNALFEVIVHWPEDKLGSFPPRALHIMSRHVSTVKPRDNTSWPRGILLSLGVIRRLRDFPTGCLNCAKSWPALREIVTCRVVTREGVYRYPTYLQGDWSYPQNMEVNMNSARFRRTFWSENVCVTRLHNDTDRFFALFCKPYRDMHMEYWTGCTEKTCEDQPQWPVTWSSINLSLLYLR